MPKRTKKWTLNIKKKKSRSKAKRDRSSRRTRIKVKPKFRKIIASRKTTIKTKKMNYKKSMILTK
jgi:hypothetical protein